jgi:hypothetical protein
MVCAGAAGSAGGGAVTAGEGAGCSAAGGAASGSGFGWVAQPAISPTAMSITPVIFNIAVFNAFLLFVELLRPLR